MRTSLDCCRNLPANRARQVSEAIATAKFICERNYEDELDEISDLRISVV
jgi:hypothetical protein